MQTGNLTKASNDDPMWQFIGEFSLCEASSNEEMGAQPETEALFQALLRVGIPPERLNRMKVSLQERARCGRSPPDPQLSGSPMRFRLFFRKKTVDRAICPGKTRIGGWGYYLIERGSDPEGQRAVELYVYKEGE